jgi:manganese oxidase
MKITRRDAVAVSGLALAGGALASGPVVAQVGHEGQGMARSLPTQPKAPDSSETAAWWIDTARTIPHSARTIVPGEAVPPGEPGPDYNPVITPNGATLPCRVVDGVKIFHLVAQEVTHEFAPGLKAKLWGFNGQVHGPTIEAVEGDRIRIYVTNRLPEATSVHWHGIILPNGMDGVSGLNQKSISPGKTFKYEYPLVQYGTYMYHSHFDGMTQMALGAMGVFVIHPRRPSEPPPNRDFAIILSEWNIKPGTYRPDPRASEFNTFTFNAKVFPATEPLVARLGDRVRIRLVNLSAADHHTIHLHGHSFWEAQTDGGVIPTSARWPEATVLVPVGQSRTMEFVADNPGDWAFHCQMTHHLKNQMGHKGPNMLGADAAMLKHAIRPLIPEYMPMGTSGMDDLTEMQTGSGHMGDKQDARGKASDHSRNTATGDSGTGSERMGMPENSIAMKGGNGPYGTIDMGGMLTILKVREHLTSYADPGWYQAPPGTVAEPATREELERDGIKVG